MTLTELRNIRKGVEGQWRTSRAPMRRILWEMMMDIDREIIDMELEELASGERSGGEPHESGMEDYLGIEDR